MYYCDYCGEEIGLSPFNRCLGCGAPPGLDAGWTDDSSVAELSPEISNQSHSYDEKE